MPITPAQFLKLIKERAKKATQIASYTLVSEAEKYVPIHTGDLRGSVMVLESKTQAASSISEFEISYGDKPGKVSGKPIRYAGYQYNSILGHLMRNDKPIRIVSRFNDSQAGLKGRKKRALAKGQMNLYARAYRRAKKAGALDKIKLEWLEKSLQDGFTLRRMEEVFINALTK